MKKLSILFSVLILSCSAFASTDPINRLDKETVKSMSDSEREERVLILEERLSEIHDLNLKSMERAERKEMKKEVRYIQNELKAQANGGVYISATLLVVIIIVLLLV